MRDAAGEPKSAGTGRFTKQNRYALALERNNNIWYILRHV